MEEKSKKKNWFKWFMYTCGGLFIITVIVIAISFIVTDDIVAEEDYRSIKLDNYKQMVVNKLGEPAYVLHDKKDILDWISNWENHLEANRDDFPQSEEFQRTVDMTLYTYDILRSMTDPSTIDNFELHVYDRENDNSGGIYYHNGQVIFRDNMFFENFD